MQKRYLFSLLALTSLINFIAVPLIATEIQSNIDQLQSGQGNNSIQQDFQSCSNNSDCDDGDPCTNEICTQPLGENGQARCLSLGRFQNCGNNSLQSCDDGDVCTTDSLASDGSCTHSRILTPECSQGSFTCDEFPGKKCCHFQSDCNDGNPDTMDMCVNRESETGYCNYSSSSEPTTNPPNSAPTVIQEEPKKENPSPVTTTIPSTTPNPDYIFGSGGCALANMGSFNVSFLFGILPVFLFWLSRKKN